jgi:type IV pilus assembly protein PilP
MMGRNPVTIRYLIRTICIVMLLWGCDSATEPPRNPKVVRKKIVSPKKQTATVPKKRTVRMAKTKTADRAVKKVRPAAVKKPPVVGIETARKPLIAKKDETQPAKQKRPAIQPKPDISETIQPPAGPEPGTGAGLIAAGPKAAMVLPGINVKYNPAGKIDPFQPLFRAKQVLTQKKKRKKRLPQTPLERIDISQLKLVGIVLASSGNLALVEESSGKGYVIKKGTYIGINSGKVVRIKKETIVIEEEFEDVFGKVATRQRQIKLPKPPGAF